MPTKFPPKAGDGTHDIDYYWAFGIVSGENQCER